MSDTLVRAYAADGFVRAFAVSAKDIVATAKVAHGTSPVCTAALGDETRVEQFRDATVIWENSYRKRKKQNCYRITMFLKDHGSMYEKLQEVHVQQAYSAETVKQLLTEAGMVFLGALDAETLEPADETSERILFLAKEGYQEGKCYDAPAEADA